MCIYQPELTSKCNLRCSDCPHGDLKRPKEHMPIEAFERALYFPFLRHVVCGRHFGEPLLHSDVLEIARLCKQKGPGFGFSANAELLSVELFEGLLSSGLMRLKSSFHAPKGKALHQSIKRRVPHFVLLTSDLEVKQRGADLVEGDGLKRRRASGDYSFHRYDLGGVPAQGESYRAAWMLMA